MEIINYRYASRVRSTSLTMTVHVALTAAFAFPSRTKAEASKQAGQKSSPRNSYVTMHTHVAFPVSFLLCQTAFSEDFNMWCFSLTLQYEH